MKSLGLYIHIPFCEKKCNYCDFYSVECSNEELRSNYINALITQIEKESDIYKNYIIDSIFFGGGTPSLISACDMEKLMSNIKKWLSVSENCEITIEINPKTVNLEKLTSYKKAGINRISIGLQSTDDDMLKRLGRIHTYKDFLSTYNMCRDVGFDNISIDLMYGLPSQSKEDFLNTLDIAVCLGAEHISAYLLKIEEKTPFGKIKDSLSLPDDDTEYEMYIEMCDYLRKNGYNQYEISNFSKKGRESKHNLKYWLSEEYVGLGPNAHSYFNKKRYSYKSNINMYIGAISEGLLPEKIFEMDDTGLSLAEEYVMLRLRLSQGISNRDFYDKFGINLLDQFPNIAKYLKSGHMEKSGDTFHFTPSGFFVSNYILSDIFE